MKLKHQFALVTLTFVISFASFVTCVAQTQSRSDGSSVAADNSQSTRVETSQSGRATQPIAAKAIESRANLFGETSSTADPDPKPQAPDPDEWHFQFSPYLWIAGINGTAGIGNLVVEVDTGLGAENVSLNSGFMGTFEARKNKFVMLIDLQYSNLEVDRANPGILFSSSDADFKTFILDPEVGYRVAENVDKRRSVDILGGIRIWRLEMNLNFGAGILAARSASASRSWVDAVGGVRGKMYLSKSIFISGKGDLGGGGSKFTWQLFGGGGIHVHPKIALVGGYRAISVNYDRDNFLFDNILHGPVLGATFVIK